MTYYTCKKCNAPASVVNGVLVRTCNCDAGVIANIQASAKGAGGMQ